MLLFLLDHIITLDLNDKKTFIKESNDLNVITKKNAARFFIMRSLAIPKKSQ